MLDEFLANPWKLSSFGELDDLKKFVEKQGLQKIDLKDDNGMTPLLWAARNGHLIVLTYLLEECKCNINNQSFGGLSALHHACNQNQGSIIKQLLKCDCKVSIPDDNGDTPLHFAAARGVLNNVSWLLEGGAEIGVANNQRVYPLHKAALNGHVVIIKKFYEKQADLNVTDSNNETSLHIASKLGHGLIVKFLLSLAIVDRSIKNSHGQTAVEMASNKLIAAMFE